ERSRIHGGRGGSSSRAISIEDGRGGGTAITAKIVNNLLHGGESASGQSWGLYMSGSSRNIDVFHNTIYAGEAGGFAHGVQYQYVSSGADVRNNVIFAVPESQHFCVYRTGGSAWSGSDETLSNNLFFGCTFAL